ncbi:hypothetical protein [Mucilaginibacter sp.]
MTDIATGSKIPTTYLPEDWREKGASEFNCSENAIERVVWGVSAGTKKNVKIFDYMLKMAEDGKAEFDKKQAEIKQRLEALTNE